MAPEANLLGAWRSVRQDGDTLHQTFGMTGTHTGTFTMHAPGAKPLPPTNKAVEIRASELVLVVRDGKIVSMNPVPGQEGAVLAFLGQMGAELPPQS